MIELRAYSDAYLNDVVENQGKLFDFISQKYPHKDTADFIHAYMVSKTRKSIDEAQAYVNTMNANELWDYFEKTDKYELKDGKALEGFLPDWIGSFMLIINGIIISRVVRLSKSSIKFFDKGL